ncbi:MAG: hypothetical protein SF051_13065 [Elusimicrobiota bacterium]|nr:hypothetical protein [Elusimicrobiota bacterium]
MKLVYEELYASYVESLQTKLRNFSVGHEFLDTWVPEEDAARGLYGLFEAAALAKVKEPLTVSVRESTLKTLDRAALEKKLAGLGKAAFADGAFTVDFAAASGAASARDAGPRSRASNADPRETPLDPRGGDRFGAAAGVGELAALTAPYAAGVAAAAAAAAFEGSLPAGPGTFRAEEGGASLAVAVDEKGLVTVARHAGARPAWKGVLDALCGVLVGRPLQEGGEHGVIRVMEALRDKSQKPPVAGILTPDNADPAFALPQRLARAVFRDWAKATGWKPSWNMWDDAPRPEWKALSEAEKRGRAEKALRSACRDLGLQEDAEVISVLQDVRLVVNFVQDKTKPSFARGMIALERRLRKDLDPRIELQLEGVEDRNTRIQRTARDQGKIK